MKYMFCLLVLGAFLSVVMPVPGQAQTTRYFQFTTDCGHGNWQDTAFIAATSDPAVIDSVLADLSRPPAERKFISGAIGYGNGGYNHNGPHQFLWHFIPNQWSLVDFSTEVCDGCPYSDVDADTAYWVGNLGNYCPWSGIVVREVTNTVDVPEPDAGGITLYPNPAHTTLLLQLPGHRLPATCTILNAMGAVVREKQAVVSGAVDIASLATGLYVLLIEDRTGSVLTRTFLKL